MRKFLIVTACLILVFVVAPVLFLFDSRGPWTNRWCTIGLQDEADSPGGEFTARGVDFLCGIVAPGYWAAVVIVKRGRRPSQDDEVLVGDIEPHGIKLSWKSPDRLEISVPMNSIIFSHKTEHAGVKIDLVKELRP